jgi:hypothetical protein
MIERDYSAPGRGSTFTVGLPVVPNVKPGIDGTTLFARDKVRA